MNRHSRSFFRGLSLHCRLQAQVKHRDGGCFIRCRNCASACAFLFAGRPLSMEAGAEELLTDEARALLGQAHAALAQSSDWEHDALDVAVRKVADEAGVKLGKLAQPLRTALTGRTTSPGIFDVLVLLGRTESLARIADQMKEPVA